MINSNVIVANIRRGVKKGMKRLRKSEWTDEPLRVAVPKVNAFLKGKYVLDGPKILFNLRLEEQKGRVVGMPEGEYYYYQIVEYDCSAYWGDNMAKFIADKGLSPL